MTLNSSVAIAVLSDTLQWAIREDARLTPNRVRWMLADQLADLPVESDLLCKAIDLNAIPLISSATTPEEFQGVTRSLVYELVRRHVSSDGAVFAVSVIAKAIKRSGLLPPLANPVSQCPGQRMDVAPARVAPEAVSTLPADIAETELDPRLKKFEYNTLAGSV